MKEANDVRIGKFIELQIEADSETEAQTMAKNAAEKLLANPVMEMFEVSVVSH